MTNGNDSGDGPPSGKPRGRTYDWLVRGGETWQELSGEPEGGAPPAPAGTAEPPPPAPAPPTPAASPAPPKMGGTVMRWLQERPGTPDGGAGAPDAIQVAVAGKTTLLPDSKASLGPLGTAIL